MAALTPGLADFRDHVEAALAFRQPRLRVAVEGDQAVVAGDFLVAPLAPGNADRGTLATYRVRVEIEPSYPEVAPFVRETGGAIPRSADFHINPDGTCCVLVWEVWRATAPDVSIGAYFDGPLRNYFLSQHVVALGGDWPFGEWAHGAEGLVVAYAERLGCMAKERAVTNFLKRHLKALRRGRLPAHWLCLCGSGKMIGTCCLDRLQRLQVELREQEAVAMLDQLTTQRAAKRRVRP